MITRREVRGLIVLWFCTLLTAGLLLGCGSRTDNGGSPTPSGVPRTTVVTPATGEATPKGIERATPVPLGEGKPPVRIRIPDLGVDVAVRPVGWRVVAAPEGRTTEWDVLPDAAGHHYGSANPGERGNVVISGHNTPGGQVFEGLATLGYRDTQPEGIRAYVQDATGRVFVYSLQHQALIFADNPSDEEKQQQETFLRPTATAQLTLVTCWPLGDTTYRLVVWGPFVGIIRPTQP